MKQILLIVLFALSFNACSSNIDYKPTPPTTVKVVTKTVIKAPKMPVYKYPIKPIITIHKKGNMNCISDKDLGALKQYINTLYYRFDKLLKVNKMLNRRYYGSSK